MATLTITIPDPVVSEYLDDFLRVYPIPVGDDDTPLYTAAEWAKEKIRRFLINKIKEGKRRAALETLTFTGDDIT